MCAIHVMNASRNGLNLAEIHSFHLISGSLFPSRAMFPNSHSILSFLHPSKPIRRCGLGFGQFISPLFFIIYSRNLQTDESHSDNK